MSVGQAIADDAAAGETDVRGAGASTPRASGVRLTENAVDESAGGVRCYKIETPTATYFLEKVGAGLSSLIDKDGHDWLGYNSTPGSRAGGEFRGFPNAVHQQAGSYFHPKNAGTDPSTTKSRTGFARTGEHFRRFQQRPLGLLPLRFLSDALHVHHDTDATG